MRARRTAGRKLVATLNKSLASDCERDERELVTFALIESAADRVEALKAHLNVELGRNEMTRRGVEIAAEVRQTEANIARMVAQLVPDPADVTAKSPQHQRAANTRWHPGVTA
jgi:hypothetical protein